AAVSAARRDRVDLRLGGSRDRVPELPGRLGPFRLESFPTAVLTDGALRVCGVHLTPVLERHAASAGLNPHVVENDRLTIPQRLRDGRLHATLVAGAVHDGQISAVRDPVGEQDVLEELARRAAGERSDAESSIEKKRIAVEDLFEGDVPDPW